MKVIRHRNAVEVKYLGLSSCITLLLNIYGFITAAIQLPVIARPTA